MRNRSVTIWLMVVVLLACVACAQANLQDGLIARYSFNSNANDESGNGNNGTVSGATLTTDRFENTNSAYVFDGIDDYIEVPNADGVFNLTESWTLACWAKPFSPATDARDDPLIWKIANISSELYSGDQDTFLLSWGYMWQEGESGNLFNTGLERATDGEDFEINSLSHIPNQWHHIVGTYDGSDLRIFVNGDLENNTTIGPVLAFTGPAPLRIGNIQHSSHIFGPPHNGVFDGIIDDVYIYNRALNETEIAELYNIPEPATLLLLGLGCLALRRKR